MKVHFILVDQIIIKQILVRLDKNKWDFRPVTMKSEIRHKFLITWDFLKHRTKINSGTVHNCLKEPQE